MTQNDLGYLNSPGVVGSSKKKNSRKKARAKKTAQKLEAAHVQEDHDDPNGFDAAPQNGYSTHNGHNGHSNGSAVASSSGSDKATMHEKSYARGSSNGESSRGFTDGLEARRASVGEKADLAESTGDIAEEEADDLSFAGVKKAGNGLHGGKAWNYKVLDKVNADGSLKNGSKPKPKAAPASTYPTLTNAAGEEAAAREQARLESYLAGGIRFAPWNIPYRRRLQTLAVLAHSLSIAMAVSTFFFFCAIPLTWPIVIPYLLHMLLSKSGTDGRLRTRSERFRRLPIWKFFGKYFPARLHKTHNLPPTRKYIFGYHPHGIISHGAFAAFGTEALGFKEKFPGITNSLLTLDSNFRIPLYRDYILALGLQSVSKESITNILTKGGTNGEGMGRAVTIVVGGARESLEAQPGIMHLVLAERKGFIKMAIRTGADLVPVLAFGENDLYDQVSPQQHPWLHKLQMWVLRTLKFTLPFLHGRGIFNYDVGLMPYRRPLNVVVGRPIMVAQAREEDIDMDEVERLHTEYVSELVGMWNRYKNTFSKDRKEELQILK